MKIGRRGYRRLFCRPYGEILTLHRVVEERSVLPPIRRLEVTPSFLEETILKYHTAGYSCVSLDEVQRRIENGKPGVDKFVCFTLDDGYADNYDVAYPVFKKLDCPFAIYVATDFPDKKVFYWWGYLEELLMDNECVKFHGVEYDCSDAEKKNQVYDIIKRFFISHKEDMRRAMDQLLGENNYTSSHDMDALWMSWEQISELASEPLCTIGAHTVSHVSLPALNDDQIRKELTEGREKIEDMIKKPVKHFCYPYGAWNERVARLTMEQFSTAVTTFHDFVRKGDGLDSLNRNVLLEP